MHFNLCALVPALDVGRVALLASRGINLSPIEPIGASVSGFNMRSRPDEETLVALQQEMATRGFLVFKDQGILSGDEQVTATSYFGGREIYSTHGVHPMAPNEHIFRLSNSEKYGILGVVCLTMLHFSVLPNSLYFFLIRFV
jgi:taurine dioxygenase